MPFCPQCGVDNPAAARYCDQCGAMLIPVAGSAPAAPAAPIASGQATCPQCGTPAILGEAFCDTCGAPLAAPARPVAPVPTPPSSAGAPQQSAFPPPQPSSAPPVQRLTPPVSAPAPVAPPAPPISTRHTLAPARLVALSSGAVLALPSAAQAVIGRADPVSKFFPDIDLTPHGALDHGVGRKHARLFVSAGRIMVEDLDSTNGTQLNGQKIAPRQPQAVHNGDTIIVGRLALRLQE